MGVLVCMLGMWLIMSSDITVVMVICLLLFGVFPLLHFQRRVCPKAPALFPRAHVKELWLDAYQHFNVLFPAGRVCNRKHLFFLSLAQTGDTNRRSIPRTDRKWERGKESI